MVLYKANSVSAVQETHFVLCNAQFHKFLSQILMLSQMNPIYVLTCYFFKNSFNITFVASVV
jgi:hypothetical protein